MSKLNNKVVIVTGASKGIGAEGAKVVANYESTKKEMIQLLLKL